MRHGQQFTHIIRINRVRAVVKCRLDAPTDVAVFFSDLAHFRPLILATDQSERNVVIHVVKISGWRLSRITLLALALARRLSCIALPAS